MTDMIERSTATGDVWRITNVTKTQNNGGRHNIFVYLRDESGNRVTDANRPRVVWTWDGIKPDEFPKPPEPKRSPDAYDYDIPLGKFMDATVWIAGANSDRATGLTSTLPDDGNGTLFHHSWDVTFQLAIDEDEKPPLPPIEPPVIKPPEIGYVTVKRKDLAMMRIVFMELVADIDYWLK